MAIPIIPAGDPQPPEPDPPYPSGSAPCSKSFSLLNPSEYPGPCGCGLSSDCPQPSSLFGFDHQFSQGGLPYVDGDGSATGLAVTFRQPATTPSGFASAEGFWRESQQRELLNPEQYNGISADTALGITVYCDFSLGVSFATPDHPLDKGAAYGLGEIALAISSFDQVSFAYRGERRAGTAEFRPHFLVRVPGNSYRTDTIGWTPPSFMQIDLDWTPGSGTVLATFSTDGGVFDEILFQKRPAFAQSCYFVPSVTLAILANPSLVVFPRQWPPDSASNASNFLAASFAA